MSTTEARGDATADTSVGSVDMKLETVVIPVSDVDRAKDVLREPRVEAGRGPRGRRLPDRPAHSPGLRRARSSSASASLRPPPARRKVSSSSPTSRRRTTSSSADGVDASEVFHDASGGYNRFDPDTRASGPDPQRRTYASFAEFSDPDGNVWQLQEITNRLPGRVDSGDDHVQLRRGSRERARSGRRPRTASTRSARARPTRTGRSGTPRTWWRSSPARSSPT